MKDIRSKARSHRKRRWAFTAASVAAAALAAEGTAAARTAVYDSSGHVVRTEDPEGATGYSYDGAGALVGVRRRARGASPRRTALLVDSSTGASRIVGEVSEAGSAQLYAFGPQGLVAQTSRAPAGAAVEPYYALNDHIRSPRALLNPAATVVGRRAYEPYGGIRHQQGLRSAYGFAGEWQAEDGTIWLRARTYDPATGRFLQRDGDYGQTSDSQSWNRYSYAEGNPNVKTDPSGHFAIAAVGIAAIVLVPLFVYYSAGRSLEYTRIERTSCPAPWADPASAQAELWAGRAQGAAALQEALVNAVTAAPGKGAGVSVPLARTELALRPSQHPAALAAAIEARRAAAARAAPPSLRIKMSLDDSRELLLPADTVFTVADAARNFRAYYGYREPKFGETKLWDHDAAGHRLGEVPDEIRDRKWNASIYDDSDINELTTFFAAVNPSPSRVLHEVTRELRLRGAQVHPWVEPMVEDHLRWMAPQAALNEMNMEQYAQAMMSSGSMHSFIMYQRMETPVACRLGQCGAGQ